MDRSRLCANDTATSDLLPTDKPSRLDRVLSHATGLSRSQVKRLLSNGQVQVDGVPVRNSALPVTAAARILLNDTLLEWPRHHYLMLHKPAGYVCSGADTAHPLVTSLIAEPWAARLHYVGRLDHDTTGLVLLTSDGSWSHVLTSPRRVCEKSYLVQLTQPLDEALVAQFAQGLLLHGESKPTLPARLEPLATHQARVWLHEGRYHQVKRMFAACGNHVASLHRERIGPIALDPALPVGAWRALQADEVGAVHA